MKTQWCHLKDSNTTRSQEEITNPRGSFTYFSRLPPELRLGVWERGHANFIQHGFKPSRNPSLFAVNRESRAVALGQYSRIINSKIEVNSENHYPKVTFSYVNINKDTIIRSLSAAESQELLERQGQVVHSGFGAYENCENIFLGLSKIKHLAFGCKFPLLYPPKFLSPILMHCPYLKTLRVFQTPHILSHESHRFFDFDSNFIDLIAFIIVSQPRKTRGKTWSSEVIKELVALNLVTRSYSSKAVAHTLSLQSGKQLEVINSGIVFQMSIMVGWSERSGGWMPEPLDLSLPYENDPRYLAESGESFDSFLQTCVVANRDGELLSRYDGVSALFETN